MVKLKNEMECFYGIKGFAQKDNVKVFVLIQSSEAEERGETDHSIYPIAFKTYNEADKFLRKHCGRPFKERGKFEEWFLDYSEVSIASVYLPKKLLRSKRYFKHS